MSILSESTRDNFLAQYIPLFTERGINASVSMLKKALLLRLADQGGLRNLSLGSNFYLAGAARYYFNGDLTLNKDLGIFTDTDDQWNEEVCERLNALIKILRNIHIDSVGTKFEQPEDFGELPINKLLRKYGAKIDAELGIVRKKKENGIDNPTDTLNRDSKVGTNGYTFDIMYSYNDCTKYYRDTYPGSWCITYGEHHYNGYTRGRKGHFVIFKQEGYENVPRPEKKEDAVGGEIPKDKYGLSLLAVLQSNDDGRVLQVTTRWNHGYGNISVPRADFALDEEGLLATVGMSREDLLRIFEIWKQGKSKGQRSGWSEERKKAEAEKLTALRSFKYMQMRINGGESIESAMSYRHTGSNDVHSDMLSLIQNKELKANKNVMLAKVNIEGIDWYVVVDKGKILFETMSRYDSPYGILDKFDYTGRKKSDKDGHQYPASHFNGIKDALLIHLPGDSGLTMIYNLRLHQFLNIEGVTKFKYIDTLQTWGMNSEEDFKEYDFFEIKMSSHQMALVNRKTLSPLKLPNGHCWFEYLSYSKKPTNWKREISTEYITNKSRILCLTYDSASNEIYFYSQASHKFLDIDPRANLEQNMAGASMGIERQMTYNGDFTVVRVGTYPSVLTIFKGEERFSIDGISTFQVFKDLGHGLIWFQPAKKNSIDSTDKSLNYLYSIDDESYITFDGKKKVAFIDIRKIRGGNYIALRLPYDSNNIRFYNLVSSQYLILDIEHKVFLYNPFDDGYVFYVYSTTSPNDEPKIKLFEPSEDNGTYSKYFKGNQKYEPMEKYINLSDLYVENEKNGLNVTAISPGSVLAEPIDVEKDERGVSAEPAVSSVNENCLITADEIAKMVMESIKKIINNL